MFWVLKIKHLMIPAFRLRELGLMGRRDRLNSGQLDVLEESWLVSYQPWFFSIL